MISTGRVIPERFFEWGSPTDPQRHELKRMAARHAENHLNTRSGVFVKDEAVLALAEEIQTRFSPLHSATPETDYENAFEWAEYFIGHIWSVESRRPLEAAQKNGYFGPALQILVERGEFNSVVVSWPSRIHHRRDAYHDHRLLIKCSFLELRGAVPKYRALGDILGDLATHLYMQSEVKGKPDLTYSELYGLVPMAPKPRNTNRKKDVLPPPPPEPTNKFGVEISVVNDAVDRRKRGELSEEDCRAIVRGETPKLTARKDRMEVEM